MHHGVRIRDEAIIAAAVLSDRYITSRFLPDKAIDLVDEAASRLEDGDREPAHRAGQGRAPDAAAQHREAGAAPRRPTRHPASACAALEKELAELGAARDAMKLQWQNEKGAIEEIRALKAELEELAIEEARCEREGNLAKAAEIKHGRIPEAPARARAKRSEQLEKLHGETRLLREEVSEEDIARVVSHVDGHPRLQDARLRDARSSSKLEKILGRRVVGQEEAIAAVADAIRRNKAGLSDLEPARWAPSCSSAPRAWARRSWPRRSPTSCSTTRRP